MTVSFVAFGPPTMASSRFRAWSVAEAWGMPCQVWQDDLAVTEDVIVLQKVHPRHKHGFALDLLDWVRRQNVEGRRVIWDLCDPIWWWMSEQEFLALAESMAAIVVSSAGLQVNLEEEFGLASTLIDDRLPYQTVQKEHGAPASPVLVWFGYAENRLPCFSATALTLERLLANSIPFSLRFIDNAPEMRLSSKSGLAAISTYVPWSLDTFWAELLKGDIALLPPYPGLWGEMKSGNKFTTAAWAGLPVVDGQSYAELVQLLTDPEYRAKEGQVLRRWAEQHGHIRQSVLEWQALLDKIHSPVEAA